jgi:hypothetical protein
MKTKILILSAGLLLAVPQFAMAQAQTRDSQSSAQQSTTMDGQRIDEASGATNEGNNWGWIGLIGLAGLFGLKRQRDVRDENYRAARA